MRRLARATSLWILCACASCSSVERSLGDGVTGSSDASDASSEDAQFVIDGVPPGDDASPDGSPIDLPHDAFCAGTGPVVGPTGACSGNLPATTFRYAMCTCDGFVTSGSLTTDSFDSTKGPYLPASAQSGGSVGTNGKFDSTALVHVGGGFWASSVEDLTTGGRVEVLDQLRTNGVVAANDDVSITHDAYVAGVRATKAFTVGGALHLPSGATLSVAGAQSIGAVVREPVNVAAPCDCDPSVLLDVPSIVAAHRLTNDDALVTLDPKALENVSTDTTLDLACGRFYLTRIGGTAPIRLRLSGRTVLFVDGDLSSNGAFTIELATPAAEADVFVAGNVVAGAGFQLGSAAQPARVRVYVGGTGTVDLSSASTFAGNVYAPRAELVLAATTEVFGSIFARRVSTGGALAIHYDTAVLDGGTCSGTTPCTSCRDCADQACVGGRCGACTSDGDCCSPLHCQQGKCVPIIY